MLVVPSMSRNLTYHHPKQEPHVSIYVGSGEDGLCKFLITCHRCQLQITNMYRQQITLMMAISDSLFREQ